MSIFFSTRNFLIASLFIFILSTDLTLAHPGRKGSDGCHYCRSNCEKWDVVTDEKHCHDGTPTPSAQTPRVEEERPPAPTKRSSGSSAPRSGGKVLGCEADNKDTRISRVVNGDTVEFVCNSRKYKVRIIGIDAPEKLNKGAECFAEESRKKLKDLIWNDRVVLGKGSNSENKDEFGRLLRYISDSGDVGGKMIKQGFAFSNKEIEHEKSTEYDNFEKEARDNMIGLWSDACDYNPNTISREEQISMIKAQIAEVLRMIELSKARV